MLIQFLVDDTGVYVGHKKTIVKYNIESGEKIWSYDITGRFVNVQRAVQVRVLSTGKNYIYYIIYKSTFIECQLMNIEQGTRSLVKMRR